MEVPSELAGRRYGIHIGDLVAALPPPLDSAAEADGPRRRHSASCAGRGTTRHRARPFRVDGERDRPRRPGVESRRSPSKRPSFFPLLRRFGHPHPSRSNGFAQRSLPPARFATFFRMNPPHKRCSDRTGRNPALSLPCSSASASIARAAARVRRGSGFSRGSFPGGHGLAPPVGVA